MERTTPPRCSVMPSTAEDRQWDGALPYLVAVDTFVGALPGVNPHVFVQARGLRKALPTHRALGGKKGDKVKRKLTTA